jgi:membrane-associated PAP2 superfamily phosphatase
VGILHDSALVGGVAHRHNLDSNHQAPVQATEHLGKAAFTNLMDMACPDMSGACGGKNSGGFVCTRLRMCSDEVDKVKARCMLI